MSRWPDPADDRAWKEKFAGLPRRASPCPGPGELSAFIAGSPEGRDEILLHLPGCADCRETVADVRADLARSASPFLIGWTAAAAALVAGLVWLLQPAPVSEPAKPAPVVRQTERPKVAPKATPVPAPEPIAPLPDPPKPLPSIPTPVPKPPEPAPAPVPTPVKPPEPVVPKTVIAEAPVKPPSGTRPKIRGALAAVAGTVSAKPEGEAAWQPVKVRQARDFSGAVQVRADGAPVKFRVGSHTMYVQRKSEITIALEEGATRVSLAAGEAFFDVTAVRDAFIVETAGGVVTVKGTRFLVTPSEVLVQKGSVEYATGGRSVTINPGDHAKRLAWVRTLEETLVLEAEAFALQQGMIALGDAAASGGRAIGSKGHPAAGKEPQAEARVQVKQAAPFVLWARLHWNHGVPSVLTIQAHDHAKWEAKDVAARPAWQWVRVGAYEFPDDPFRLRIADPRGDTRVDQVLLTTDLEYNPEEEKKR